MKQSETTTIKRSQINLNPFNPKNHTEEQIKMQKRNLKKVGFLGGVVWNSLSGNLIDGHRRLQALDQINKYDGSSESDYEVKVEMVSFDAKTEKEQMTYMAVGNSKADYNLIAEYIGDIDYTDVGLSESEYSAILDLQASVDIPDIEVMEDEFLSKPKQEVTELLEKEATLSEIQQMHDEKPKMTKEQVKAEKKFCTDYSDNQKSSYNLYAIVKFKTEEEMMNFCELFEIEFSNNIVVQSSQILSRIE